MTAIVENRSHIAEYRSRLTDLRKNPECANQRVRSFNLPDISAADYIELVDFTGREWHAGKRGKIAASKPQALTKLG